MPNGADFEAVLPKFYSADAAEKDLKTLVESGVIRQFTTDHFRVAGTHFSMELNDGTLLRHVSRTEVKFFVLGILQ